MLAFRCFMLSSAYVGAIAVCSSLAFLILHMNNIDTYDVLKSKSISRNSTKIAKKKTWPEKNLVNPQSSLPRSNASSFLLGADDGVQADVDVLLLPLV